MYTEWRLSGHSTGNQQNDENQPPPMPSSVGPFSQSSSSYPVPGARHPYVVNPPVENYANTNTRPFSDQVYHTPCSLPCQQPFGQVQYANGAPFVLDLHTPVVPHLNHSNAVIQPEVDATVTKARQVSKVPRASGAGSKSGSRNRRKLGGSDDEISKLSGKGKRAAGLKDSKIKGENSRGLTEDEKLKATSYITDEKIWKNFRLKQMSVFIHISSKILEGRVTAIQISNFWMGQAWEKYKAVRRNQEHTGGGDGDEDRDLPSDTGNSGDSDTDDSSSHGKRKQRPKRSTKTKFSRKILDEFERSEIFRLIDNVAHDDESVVRHRDFNSSAPISDDETPAKKRHQKYKSRSDLDSATPDVSKFLMQALQGMEDKHRVQKELEDAKLELSIKRDQREQEEREEKRAEAKRKEIFEKRETRAREWKLVIDMLANANPLVQAQGQKMAERLTAEGDT